MGVAGWPVRYSSRGGSGRSGGRSGDLTSIGAALVLGALLALAADARTAAVAASVVPLDGPSAQPVPGPRVAGEAAAPEPGSEATDSLRDDEVLVAAVDRATVSVHGTVDGRPVAGSGFTVDGRVVTNGHVVGSGPTATVDDGQAIAGHLVIATAGRRDLALLVPTEPDRRSVANLALADHDPIAGRPVLLAGRINGRLELIDATVQGVVGGAAYGIDGPVVLIEGASWPGLSGGPVVSSGGEVVAVLQALDRATGLAIAIPVSELDDLLTATGAG